VIILKEHSTLKSLCGNNGDETELGMSGKMDGAGDAIMLVAEIVGNGALMKLDISDNSLYPAGARVLAEALQGNQVITELNIASNSLSRNANLKVDISGVAALVDVIPGIGAMKSLSLASNNLGVEGAKIVAAVLPKCT
jgi:hypothetical protein